MRDQPLGVGHRRDHARPCLSCGNLQMHPQVKLPCTLEGIQTAALLRESNVRVTITGELGGGASPAGARPTGCHLMGSPLISTNLH